MSKISYLSLGAGIQSGTLVEMMVAGQLGKVDWVIFADTGNEPGTVYEYLEYLEGRLKSIGVPLIKVRKGNLLEDLQRKKGRFAAIPVFTVQAGRVGRLRRQCTREYKIEPIEKYVGQQLAERGLATYDTIQRIRVKKGVEVSGLLGISLDEALRMRPSRRWWITNVFPLVDKRMTRNDCVQWLRRQGVPIPVKSSCIVCPFHKDNYWRDMRDNRPNEWEQVVDFDQFLRDPDNPPFVATAKGDLFLHRQCVPMNQVDLSNHHDEGQLDFFDICDEGYCFI